MCVPPGTCKLFGNPCGSSPDWLNPAAPLPDAFQLFGSPDSAYLGRDVSNGVTARSICVREGAGTIINDSINFTYGYDTFDRGYQFGRGRLTLTVAPVLTVVASATPATIDFGEASQLVTQVSGGISPYSYLWIPEGGLSASNIPAPQASPHLTTTYDVTVTDGAGQIVHTTVTVNVHFELQVTAIPQVINPGDISQLNANPVGGSPPYTFIWEASADSLSDPTLSSPLAGAPGAQPHITTTYTVTATDAHGVARTGAVEVTVNLSANPTATPGTIDAGHSAQLDANPLGGDGQYTYSWSPTTGLDNPTSRTPMASPSATTTYTVTVTDAHGLTATGQVQVVNTADPVPIASFTFTRVPCSAMTPCSNGATSGQEVFLDGSGSTGSIVSYTWNLSWTAPSPDVVTSGPTASVVLEEGNQRGNIILTVTAADGQTAMFSRRFP